MRNCPGLLVSYIYEAGYHHSPVGDKAAISRKFRTSFASYIRPMKDTLLRFPDNFLWGAGTSAHQVEGHNNNDWSCWEAENCKKLASAAKSGCHSRNRHSFPAALLKIGPSAEDPDNYISGPACDHYNRFSDDFELARKLNHNAHRISIEWSRIEPEEGNFDQGEIDHYRKVVLSLRERGIEPFVTLWHFTNPVWLEKKGGWKAKKVRTYYSRYVSRVVEHLKDEVVYWITINEPMVYAASSYLFGRFPPMKRNPVSFLLAIRNLMEAHKTAYKNIKNVIPDAQIGIAKNIIYFDAHNNGVLNIFLKKSADWFWNNCFLDRIRTYQDYIGMNHYFYNRINFGFSRNENKVLSDMGWELYPEAIYYSLKEMQKYMKPVYITENGLADTVDDKRAWYIREILKNVHRAIKEDIDIRGYFYWSLLDNFEWHKGFWPRFGLIEVDYDNFNRRVRKSAEEYAKIVRDNGIAIDGSLS